MTPISTVVDSHDQLTTYQRNLVADIEALEQELAQDQCSVDEWFSSLGPDWTDYEAKLQIALLIKQAKRTSIEPDPELRFHYRVHFPFWQPF